MRSRPARTLLTLIGLVVGCLPSVAQLRPGSCPAELIRVGVVGVGKMGTYHLQQYSQMPDEVKVIGVFDVNQAGGRAVAEANGTIAFSDLDQLLREVDAISIATHTSSHYPIAKQALQSGVHVLVEKPMTADPDKFEDLARLARQQNLILRPGLIEDLRYRALSRGLEPFAPHYIETHRTNTAAPRDKSMDVVEDLLIHDLDLVLHIAGTEPTRVKVVGRSVGSGVYDRALVTLEFPNGIIAKLHAGRSDLVNNRRMTLISADRRVELDFMGNSMNFHIGGSPTPALARRAVAINSLREELRDFIRSVRTAEPSAVSAQRGAVVLRVLKRIRDSGGDP